MIDNEQERTWATERHQCEVRFLIMRRRKNLKSYEKLKQGIIEKRGAEAFKNLEREVFGQIAAGNKGYHGQWFDRKAH
jgi:hypothetical protein